MIISFVNQKGGCGKSTTVQALAEIYGEKGHSVLVVDGDGQMDLTSKVLPPSTDTAGDFFDLVHGGDPEGLITKTKYFDLIPGTPDTFSINDPHTVAADPGELLSHEALRTALEPVKHKYNFIFIDLGPQLGDVQKMALVASDGVIIPCECDISSLNAVVALSDTIEAVKPVNESLKVLGVLLTRYDGRATATRQTAELFRETLKDYNYKVFDTAIRSSIRVREAAAMCLPMIEHGAKSTTIADYRSLTKEIKRIMGGGKNGRH